MRRQRRLLRRPRIGPLGRAAAWLVTFALLIQCAVDTGAALTMWIEANGPGQVAQAGCAEHGSSGKQGQHPGHDHEHCLICNTAVSDCPAAIMPLILAASYASASPVPAPESVVRRKFVHANAARGPPGLA